MKKIISTNILLTCFITSLCLFGACSEDSNRVSSSTSESLEGFELASYANMGGLQRATKKDAQGKLLEEGDLLNGQKEGTWLVYHTKANQKHIVGSITSYRNGKKHGSIVKINDRGNLTERAQYVNGQLNGPRMLYNNSRIAEDAIYQDGQLHGKRTVYYQDGKTLKEEGNFKDGKRHGINKWYNEDGEVTIEYEYKNGKRMEK